MHIKPLNTIFLTILCVTTVSNMHSMQPSTMRCAAKKALSSQFVLAPCGFQRSFWWLKWKPDQEIATQKDTKYIIENSIMYAHPTIHTPQPLAKNGLQALRGKRSPKIDELVCFLKNRKKYDRMGAHVPTGLLMVGKPGTGKTAIARGMAEEAGIPFSFACPSDFQSRWIGDTEKAINKFFNEARNSARNHVSKSALAFIDEIDVLGSRKSFTTEHIAYSQAIATVLNQMDGIQQHDVMLYVWAATNCAQSIDPALKRPGRLDRIIEIPLPDPEDRQEILHYYAGATRYHKNNVNFVQLAEATQNYTPADLQHLVNEAALDAVRAGDDHITMKNYTNALLQFEERKKVDNSNSLYT